MKIRGVCFYIWISFLIVTSMSESIRAIALVYNLNIKTFFVVSDILDLSKPVIWFVDATPVVCLMNQSIFVPQLDVDVYEKRSFGGVLFDVRSYFSNGWWLGVATGLEKEHLRSTGTTESVASRTGFDDILTSIGYNFIGKSDQFVLYGIAGLPTKKTLTRCETWGTLVGTRLHSVGLGWEYSHQFTLSTGNKIIFIFQHRFMHFFSRKWFPILPCEDEFQPGNMNDSLWALAYRTDKYLFEARYNPTIFTNQSILTPGRIVEIKNYVRNNISCDFARVWKSFPGIGVPGLLGFGIDRTWSQHFNQRFWIGWLNLVLFF